MADHRQTRTTESVYRRELRPSNHHWRRDKGPDLSVLSRSLIGVDGPILRGSILACRVPAAAGERKGECDSVDLYWVALSHSLPSADGGYRRVGWFACRVRGLDGQVREAAVEPAG